MTEADPQEPGAPRGDGPAPGDHATEEPKARRVVVGVVAALIVVVALAGGALAVAARGSSESNHTYEIPPGTQAAIAAGDDVEIIPAEMHLAPNDELTITNHDTAVHSIGLFTVRPGETVNYRFPNPGVFRGACTVHPTGALTIYVE